MKDDKMEKIEKINKDDIFDITFVGEKDNTVCEMEETNDSITFENKNHELNNEDSKNLSDEEMYIFKVLKYFKLQFKVE